MIGSFSSGATASLVVKNGTKKLPHLFEELQVSNSEFKLIIPKPIFETYFETNLSRATVDKTITSGHILVFEVSKRLS